MFRRAIGQSPKRFIIESRMRHAATLLAEAPARSIKEISEIAGYTTVQAFSRAFRQALGTSPAAFRRAPHIGRGPSAVISH
jgi:AraC family transcriptional regulator